MKELLEKVQVLFDSLVAKNQQADEHQVVLDKRQVNQDARGEELNNFQAELLQREADIKPIEDIGKTQREATQSKAEADLEWSKIRGEWDKIDAAKAKYHEECRIEKEAIEGQKVLYNRGAEENKKAKEVLDEKLKKFKEATGG